MNFEKKVHVDLAGTNLSKMYFNFDFFISIRPIFPTYPMCFANSSE